LFRIITLRNFEALEAVRLRRYVSSFNLLTPFNLSYVDLGKEKMAALRASTGLKSRDIRSYLIFDSLGEIRLVDLSTYVTKFGIPSCADPKLFLMGAEVYCTFNTGGRQGSSIYLMRIFPDLEQPWECVYANRSQQEKNWAFFCHQNRLTALYSIRPPQLIEEVSRLESSGKKYINFSSLGPIQPRVANGLPMAFDVRIGTPIASVNDRYLFVGHLKISILGWKLYLGRPMEVVYDEGVVSIKKSRIILIHSFRSLFGSLRKPNRKLISCTYFSGISSIGGRVNLSYGINDINFGVSTNSWRELWL
jgi:hypothetical protein